ncbi:bile acid-coenzyme A ligase [Tamaricihabitans halophyticus]|uniref:Bile acid-coenzyme A ligase n=1 Tax=Tamaricihabitans halophyticus TaxID=1262583 RepID=A0A4R2QDT9_9PSEU|nr:AMP-binding protein [Tamaricihabitans halophyticus]TCP47233.1 bile acid-coenzyme A ligase [Tamaricihabitans halophyticus]
MSTAQPIGRILRQLAEEDPDRPSVTCGQDTITRAELESESNRLARVFAERGVGIGDLVTVSMPNSIESYLAFAAAWKLGAIPQPVSHRLPEFERAAVLELANPALVVGAEVAGRPWLPADFRAPAELSAAPLPDRVSPAWKAPTSGGSTGQPKIILSGQSGLLDPEEGAQRRRMRRDDVQLVPGPLYHNTPMTYSGLGLFLGMHLVVMSKFDTLDTLREIERHRVSYVCLVPTMMSRIWRTVQDNPGRFDLSSVRTVWHMAAPCPAWLKDAWIELVGQDAVWELYGSTEAQAVSTIGGREWLTRRGSVGRAVTGEFTVLDADRRPVAPGEIGEIFARRPAGAPPTYRYIGATASCAGNGWETVGDLGWMDADGYLYLSDRRTDLILSGGANIYPAEVEGVLDAHPAVHSSAVVGLPDADLGQRVHAVVHAEGAVTVAELLALLRERLVRYKVPRSIELVTEPLRDDAGKVRRSAIRDAAARRQPR